MDRLSLTTASLSLCLHLAALATLPREAPAALQEEEIAFDLAEPPAVQPEEETRDEPVEQEAGPDPVAAEPEVAAAPLPPPAPAAAPTPAGDSPTAAEAGQVLTAEGDAGQEVADFTMVQGEATRYAGGVTASRGRSPRPVARVGEPRRKPADRALPRVAASEDRSRPARPTQRSWSCSHLFPQAADTAEIHHAIVTVVVRVGSAGEARAVSVVGDPGHGFAAAARTCALGQRYHAALDASGRPVDGSTAPFSIRFVR